MIGPSTAIGSNIILFGYNERPIVGWRKFMIDVYYKSMHYAIAVTHLMVMFKEDLDDYDYSEWLGPNYKETQELPQKVSTIIIAPHTCWIETIICGGIHQPAFCVKKEGEKVPVLRGIMYG